MQKPQSHTTLPYPDVTALILAGGRGSRMQHQDKGLVPVCGRPLIEWALEAVRGQVADILISANRNVETYARYGYPVVRDEGGDYTGPLAGIAAGLRQTHTPWLFVLPCDAPRLPPDTLERLHAKAQLASTSITCLADPRHLQPLIALYAASLRDDLARYLAAGERKVESWVRQHHPAQVMLSSAEPLCPNLNSATDIHAFEERYCDKAP